MLSGKVKNISAEALMRAFNSNPNRLSRPPPQRRSATGKCHLTPGLLCACSSLLCRVDASPYDDAQRQLQISGPKSGSPGAPR